MSWQKKKGRGTAYAAVVLAVAALGAGCKEPSVPAASAAGIAGRAAALHGTHATAISGSQLADVEDVLRELKRLTLPYRNLDVAHAAGYDASLTPCMELPGAGGMGFHYGSLALFDAKVEPLRPEILVYEPQKNGKLDLVAVEYAVPYSAWTSPSPPTLAGVPLHKNDTFQLWVIHAWVWKHNPSGVLTDWNPRVTCRYAPNGS